MFFFLIVQLVVTDTLARFFSFHPFQNVFCFFVVSKPNSDRFPNTRPSFPWSTTLAQKWLKQATFPVVLASVFSFMFSIHQLLMISIHHAVVKLFFPFSIILLVLLNNSSYIFIFKESAWGNCRYYLKLPTIRMWGILVYKQQEATY